MASSSRFVMQVSDLGCTSAAILFSFMGGASGRRAPVTTKEQRYSSGCLARPLTLRLRPVPSPRVLIVDDDEGVREFLREALAGEGYEVNEAVDGQDALDQ